MRIREGDLPPSELLDFPEWCARRGLPGVGFTGRCWWAEGLDRAEWRRVYDAAGAWADELAPWRDRWPAHFVPFDDFVSDVLGQLPIDPADVAAELMALPNNWRVIAPGVPPRKWQKQVVQYS